MNEDNQEDFLIEGIVVSEIFATIEKVNNRTIPRFTKILRRIFIAAGEVGRLVGEGKDVEVEEG